MRAERQSARTLQHVAMRRGREMHIGRQIEVGIANGGAGGARDADVQCTCGRDGDREETAGRWGSDEFGNGVRNRVRQ